MKFRLGTTVLLSVRQRDFDKWYKGFSEKQKAEYTSPECSEIIAIHNRKYQKRKSKILDLPLG